MRSRLVTAAWVVWLLGCGQGPVPLSPAHPLSEGLRSFEVTRVGPGGERATARFDAAVLSARSMHERGLEAPEGEVHGRWVLGEPAWDAVGRTRQRSGGEPADGLWAHPRDATELVIESRVSITGAALEGFYGLTDFSIEHARRGGVEAPVRFELALDGRVLIDAEARRLPGWVAFRAQVPGAGPGSRRLRVRIASDDDSWAHFVFDVRGAADPEP